MNYWAVVVAAVSALVTSSAYYIAFGSVWLALQGPSAAARPGPAEISVQCVQNIAIALAFAYVLKCTATKGVLPALRVGVVVWAGIEAMAIAGSVLHENYPIGLYLLHCGDALIMTLVMALILGAWRNRKLEERA